MERIVLHSMDDNQGYKEMELYEDMDLREIKEQLHMAVDDDFNGDSGKCDLFKEDYSLSYNVEITHREELESKDIEIIKKAVIEILAKGYKDIYYDFCLLTVEDVVNDNNAKGIRVHIDYRENEY